MTGNEEFCPTNHFSSCMGMMLCDASRKLSTTLSLQRGLFAKRGSLWVGSLIFCWYFIHTVMGSFFDVSVRMTHQDYMKILDNHVLPFTYRRMEEYNILHPVSRRTIVASIGLKNVFT